MMTKSEFYKSLIKVQKETGQGLSGIVKLMGEDRHRISQYLEEFIKEGLIEACHTGNSIGDPETNIFYMPTKGYNVWKDDGVDGVYQRYKGRYLHFVRLYLGAMDKTPDIGKDEDHKWMNPSMVDYLQNVEEMEEYTKWLKRNDKALQEMLNLDDSYIEKDMEFSDREVEWVKSKEWFEENLTISSCLKKSTEAAFENESINRQMISLSSQLVNAYVKSGASPNDPRILKAEKESEECEFDITTRKKINRWLESQNQESKIQSLFK